MRFDKHSWWPNNLLWCFILGLFVLIYILAVPWVFREFSSLLKQTDGTADLKIILTVVAALIAAPFVAWQARIASDRAETAKEEHITNRINKAVEQLSAKEHIESRIGGLYALERIAQDSERDHITIMEIICTFIRENAKVKKIRIMSHSPQIIRQTAISILGRRKEKRIKYEKREKFQLHLNGINLEKIDLEKSNLVNAWLQDTKFNHSYLGGINLDGTWLARANFNGAIFDKESTLNNAALYRTDFRHAKNLTLEMLSKAIGVKKGMGQTLLPDYIMDYPDTWIVTEGNESESMITFEEHWREKTDDTTPI